MKIASFESKSQSCPICSSAKIGTWRSKFVDGVNFHLDLCDSCSYVFVNPRPSFDFLLEFYSSNGPGNVEFATKASVLEEEELSPNSTLDAVRLISRITSLRKTENNKFLDVGCGYGFFSREALNQGYDVISIELAENEREVAKDMTDVEPLNVSFEEFYAPPGSLSVVLMSQILEHALDVNLWISKAFDMLETHGIIAIAVPNFGSIFRRIMQENEPYIIPPAHLNFFNPGSLSRLLTKHGFQVEAVEHVSRIKKDAFQKRMPRIGRPFLPATYILSGATLRFIDFSRLGMFINVYARKTV